MDNNNSNRHHRQDLGVSVELDPAVAQDLRQQEEKRRRKRDSRRQQQQQQQQQQQSDNDDDESDNDDDVSNNHRLQNDEEDDWNHVIRTIENATGREKITSSSGTTHDGEAMIKSSDNDPPNDYEQDDDDDDIVEEEIDEISLAPDDPMASSLPVVLVNIPRLVGYQPSSLDEVECLKLQIQSALYGIQQPDDDDEENTDPTTKTATAATGNNDPENTTTRRKQQCDDDFDVRLVEMFINNSAHHSDTVRVAQVQQQQPYSFAVVSYPDLLCRKQHDPSLLLDQQEEVRTVYTTRQIWKSLLKRHVVPVVNRIFVHLRNCSRSLLWKYDLRCELLELCRDQYRQLQQNKLQVWRMGQRHDKLQKLYHVREMFVHRLEMAQEHLDIFNQQREELVQHTLQRLQRSNQTGHAIGVQALDFATTSVMSFPTQQEMNQLGVSIGNSLIIGLQNDDDDDDYGDDGYYDDDYVPISSDDEENEAYDDFEQNDDDLEPAPETLGLIDLEADGGAADTVATMETTAAAADEMMASGDDDNAAECVDNFLSERVAKRDSRRQAARQRRLQQVATAKEEEHKAKLEAAKKDEERIREACTTQEHKIAMAKVQCFQDRLTGVDSLLESLQEDEWADEEEETTEGEEQLSSRVAPNIGEENDRIDKQRNGSGGEDRDNDRMDFTLLDQVLISVLGSIHVPVGTRAADHAAWLRTEHLEIVAAWKEHFGSLPPLLNPSSSSSSSSGLVDQHGVGASSFVGSTTTPFQAADVVPSATRTDKTTNVRSNGQTSTTQAAWGPNAAASGTSQQHVPVPVSRPAHEMRQSLGIVDNEAEDWEA